MSYIDNAADILNVSDITDRVEELETERDEYEPPTELAALYNAVPNATAWGMENRHDEVELAELLALLDDLRGNGGDHQWRGDWYPGYLIRDSYFVDYARETVQDCGYIPADLPTWIVVDWDATADQVREDYTNTDIDGVTYWFR